MPLVSLPKELVGINWVREIDLDTGIGELKLPNDATPEQKKAYKEFQKRCEKAQRDRCVIRSMPIISKKL